MKRCSTLKLTEWPVAIGVGALGGLDPSPNALWYDAQRSAMLSPPVSAKSPLRPENSGKIGFYLNETVMSAILGYTQLFGVERV